MNELTDIMDQLNIEGDSEFKKLINHGNYLIFLFLIESIFFSSKVKKYNSYDWKQERSLVISEKNIYIFKAKSNHFFSNI